MCVTVALAGLLLAVSGLRAQTAAKSVGLGKIDVTADSSVAAPGYVIYKNARLVAQNGATMNADEMRANLTAKGNQIENAVLTGHVVAHLKQEDLARTYTVNADKAVFDPKPNTVTLTGNVVVTVITPYTQGPFVQTGQSGLVQLGKGPDFPVITMYRIHTVFTPNQ
jgi:lipopolysaccharide export system protein LptA